MKLGLLEFGTGCLSPMDIVDNVLEYAQCADELGYTRFWLGEHHGASPAYCNPEVLVPIIAGLTTHCKVGVAGLLMAYHNPYRVASAFKVLNNLFPHRIDLGIAGGNYPAEIGRHLVPDLDFTQPGVKVNTFVRNSKAVYDYLNALENANQVVPYSGYIPTMWSLTAGLNSLSAIAKLKTSLCRSVFHTVIDDHRRDAETLQLYRREFYENHHIAPEINLAVAGICAETDTKARRIREKLERPISVTNELIGSPTYILDELARLSELYNVAEFIFLNMAEETVDKRNGIEALANRLPDYKVTPNSVVVYTNPLEIHNWDNRIAAV